MALNDSSVLVVDDDPAVGKVLGALLAQDGIASVTVRSGATALEELGRAFRFGGDGLAHAAGNGRPATVGASTGGLP